MKQPNPDWQPVEPGTIAAVFVQLIEDENGQIVEQVIELHNPTEPTAALDWDSLVRIDK